MRRFSFGFLILLVVTNTIACVKFDPKTPTDPEVKMELLKVDSNFDWKTSRDVKFSITADYSSIIRITSLDGKVNYHIGFYSKFPEAYSITINLPTYINSVLVNGKLVQISGTSAQISLTSSVGLLSNNANNSISTDGLIAAWKFEENVDDKVNDLLGKYNGTLSGGSWVKGISGSAIEFDGVSGSILIPRDSGFNPTGNKISFSLWFKLSETGASGTFLFQNVKFTLRIDPQGKVSLALYTPAYKSVVMPHANRIIDINWHHVAATYDGAEMKLYVDGKLQATESNTGNIQSSKADLIIGMQSSINPLKGILDEVLIYDKALTESEIVNIFSTTPNPSNGSDNLVSAWDFDENEGVVAADKIGTNKGSISNALWGKGVEGSCLEFNGSNSNVNIPNSASLSPSSAITMMLWAKAQENKSSKIFQKGDWDGHGIGQDVWNGWQVNIRLDDNTSLSLEWGAGRPVLNEWYHLALTYDGSVLKMYVNGQLKSSKAVSGKLKVTSRDISIGSDNSNQKFFRGSIDDVKFFGVALSQTEIQRNFSEFGTNSDKDGDGIPDVSDSYPADPARAFNNFFPADGMGSIAFEDMWPSKGDYDFNDLVLDYQFKIVTDAANKVADVSGTFVIRAIGAEFSNGFGFQFPGKNINESDIHVEGAILNEDFIKLNSGGTEAGQERATIIVFDNVNKIMSSTSGFGVNVVPGTPYVNPATIIINIGFTPGVYTINDLDINNFNPFLIVNKDRGKEIHLPNYPPTSLVNTSYFGTDFDNSSPSTGNYYKSSTNLPWAIKVASSYDYTIEKAQITSAYLNFSDWAQSSGIKYPDWYLNKAGYRYSGNIFK